MRKIRDNFDWQEYLRQLDEIGVAGHPYPFEHMNEPDDFPCMCETLIDDDKAGRVQLVHVFFFLEDANELLGITIQAPEETDDSGEPDVVEPES